MKLITSIVLSCIIFLTTLASGASFAAISGEVFDQWAFLFPKKIIVGWKSAAPSDIALHQHRRGHLKHVDIDLKNCRISH